MRIDGRQGSTHAQLERVALKSMPGVRSVKVDLKAAEARVVIDPSVTSAEKIRQKTMQTGYQAGDCSPLVCEQYRKKGVLSRLRGK